MGNNPTKQTKPVNEQEHKFGGYKNSDKPRPGYYITPSDVYYRGSPIKDALPSSFVKLKNSWAKDSNRVYFQGLPIREADPKSFTTDNKFGQDRNGKWYRGKLVK